MQLTTPRKAWLCSFTLASLAVLLIGAASASANGHARSADKPLIVLTPQLAPGLDNDGPGANTPGQWQMYRNVYSRLVVYPTTQQGAVLVPNTSSTRCSSCPSLPSRTRRRGSSGRSSSARASRAAPATS